MSRFARSAMDLMFGAFNGIQVFIYPALLFYWLDSMSLVTWFSGLLSTKLHHLPFILFLMSFFYMGFLLFKYSSYESLNVARQQRVKDLIRFLFELHKGLLLLLFVAIMIYVLSSFLAYFYNIQIPLKRIYAKLFQYVSITLIIFYYIQSVWTKPFRQRGQGMERAINSVISFSRRNPLQVLRFTALIVIVVFSFTRLYLIVVSHLVNPVMDYFTILGGDSLKLGLLTSKNSLELLYNSLVIMVAFLLSNLLFSPLVLAGTKLLNYLHPIKVKVLDAQTDD